MPLSSSRFLALLMVAVMALPAPIWAESSPAKAPSMNAQKRAAHALNRLAFGPRPGDLERVQKMGVDAWIEQQLHPEKLDDSAVQARLAPYRTLNMSAREMIENFPPPQVLKAIAEGKQSLPEDPAKRAMYETQLEAYKARRERKAAEDAGNAPSEIDPQPMVRPQRLIITELAGAKLVRAVYSDRQLEEVMTDFWFNHFNVYFNKAADRYLTTSYERNVIRKHAFGKFEDLLVATATSPAMLFYLDNFQSVGPDSPAGKGEMGRGRGLRRFARQVPPANGTRTKRGLNENYARELMELHTLGVDGGYTQQDVTEVAKVFTGWTIRQPRQGGGYEFRPQLHEPGDKKVLGKTIHSGGEDEGRQVLHMLATSPATAKFISKKLAVRFVADDPPRALVDRMAQTFTTTHGDIRAVLRTLFKSPEFWAPDAYRAKVKTPFEFVVSALRGTGSEISDPRQLLQTLNQMGELLYGMQPPTGYSMKAETWVNSAALINRMNFSLALSAGRVRGVQMSNEMSAANTNDPAALDSLTRALLAGDVSANTQATVRKQLADPSSAQPAMLAGLLLGSPEFQRR